MSDQVDFDEYDNEDKQLAWKYFFDGYSAGRGVESLGAVPKKTARDLFERTWEKEEE